MRISDSSVDEVGIETVLAEQAGTFMLYYERVLPPLLLPSMLYAESVKTRSSEETVVATPTPHSPTHDATPAHAPERRKRTHSVANNEPEEEKQVKVKVEQMTGANPRPDIRFPLVNGEHVNLGTCARIIRSTSVGVRSGSRSRSSSVAAPLPPAADDVNIANGHAAPTAAPAATVQVPLPLPTIKVNGVMAHGPPTKQGQSPARKRKKKKSSGFGKGDLNTNGAPPRTLVGSGSID